MAMYGLGGFLHSLDSQIYENLPGLGLWNREDRREGVLSELEVEFCPWWWWLLITFSGVVDITFRQTLMVTKSFGSCSASSVQILDIAGYYISVQANPFCLNDINI